MSETTTAGVYMLAIEHADALQHLASDPVLAQLLGIAHPPRPGAVADAIARIDAERVAGTSFWNAIVDRKQVGGVSGIIEPYGDDPLLRIWIDPRVRGRGYGGLAARLGLDFVFRNLHRQHVVTSADASDPAQAYLLAKFGFAPDASTGTFDVTRFRLTRDEWIAHRDGPALARLHPALRVILDAELAAGNEVAETGGGWPDADSVFVRLRGPFRTTPDPMPPGVIYTEPNDPHWWRADYSSVSPRHILAS
jgi:RimJ/RimL family protein N-acetyltransferase